MQPSGVLVPRAREVVERGLEASAELTGEAGAGAQGGRVLPVGKVLLGQHRLAVQALKPENRKIVKIRLLHTCA